MKYAQVFTCDIANGPGCRTSLFVSGCTHHCKDCFNEVAWDFNYGREFDSQVQDELIKESRPSYIDGFTFLGGEPMEVANQKHCVRFWNGSGRSCQEKISGSIPGTPTRN